MHYVEVFQTLNVETRSCGIFLFAASRVDSFSYTERAEFRFDRFVLDSDRLSGPESNS